MQHAPRVVDASAVRPYRLKDPLAVIRVTNAMSGTEFQFPCLTDPRLAAHALSPLPVWLWSADATRVLWSNPGAAAIFDAASPGVLAAIRFDPQHAAAAQFLCLAGTLPQGGAARLERLRGFGAGSDGTLTCLCSRFVLADNT